MRLKKFLILTIAIFLFTFQFLSAQIFDDLDECTIGVASGRATADGRPLVWKTRDYKSAPDNEVYYFDSYPNAYIAVITAGSTLPWMGVNEKGFAIVNSLSEDLEKASSGMGNGSFMKEALRTCDNIADFEDLLIATNSSGRKTQANFAVIDASGGAAIFETAGHEYWKFDANDESVAPLGYVLRTNFAFNGEAKNGLHDGIHSIERYRRQRTLISEFHQGDSLNYRSILRYQMRDFSDFDSQPVPVPYPSRWRSDRPFGYIYTGVSICRSTSVSTAVIQGILPGESPFLSTMWVILGQPAGSMAVPYFPVGQTPNIARGSNSAPLCDIARNIRSVLFDYAPNDNYIDSYKLLDGQGGGLWTKTFPAEDSIFIAFEDKISVWRQSGFSTDSLLSLEDELANYAFRKLNEFYTGMTTSVLAEKTKKNIPNKFQLFQNYPNPFNATTTIAFQLSSSGFVTVKITDVLGRSVATLLSEQKSVGEYQLRWNANDVASGIYFYQMQFAPMNGKPVKNVVRKLVLSK
ncbi:MAG: T9SS type A sorting domain-containing protein [Calditrichaeota bacterium]|nr:T9SS type A sorting domain-containing protein [Calditrichota bacterium]